MISLADGARQFGIELTPEQHAAFETYCRELPAWNARMNLTAITERDQVIVKHFLDSLSVAPIVRSVIASRTFAPLSVNSAAKQSPTSELGIASSQRTLLAMTNRDALRLIDIGAGAGFPGLPLKIVFPELRVTLLETTGKKVTFLKHMIAQLRVPDAVAIQARAEDLGRDPAHRERYDVAVARAVANLATLLEYALPFVRPGGMFIAQKSVEVDEEIRQAERALQTLGGRVRQIVPVQLPGLEPRHLIVVEKIAATPADYPRRAGVPERKPIK